MKVHYIGSAQLKCANVLCPNTSATTNPLPGSVSRVVLDDSRRKTSPIHAYARSRKRYLVVRGTGAFGEPHGPGGRAASCPVSLTWRSDEANHPLLERRRSGHSARARLALSREGLSSDERTKRILAQKLEAQSGESNAYGASTRKGPLVRIVRIRERETKASCRRRHRRQTTYPYVFPSMELLLFSWGWK